MWDGDVMFVSMLKLFTFLAFGLFLWYLLRTLKKLLWVFNPAMGLLVFVGVLVAYRYLFNYLPVEESFHIFVFKILYDILNMMPNPYTLYEEVARQMG